PSGPWRYPMPKLEENRRWAGHSCPAGRTGMSGPPSVADRLQDIEAARADSGRGESFRFGRRAQGPSAVVVEGFVEQKDLARAEAKPLQLTFELVIGVRSETAAEKAAEVFGT